MRFAGLGLLVIVLLAACDTGAAPPVAPTLEASVGTYAGATSTSTALSVLARTPDSTSAVTIAGTTGVLEGLEISAGIDHVFAVRASSLPVERDGSNLNTQPNSSGGYTFFSVPADD